MKGIFLPLFAITCTVVVTGIEVFQTSPSTPGLKTAELIFVILLAILFGLGILTTVKRNKSIKEGLPADDELSKKLVRISAATAFFMSLIIWLSVLILNVHTDLNSKFLIGIGIMAMCLVFLIVWTAQSMLKTED